MASKEKEISKVQQERVQSLLIDTVTLLCKNSITFQDELKVEGLLGITVDKEVFLVNINEKFCEEKEPEPEEEEVPEPRRGSKRSHDGQNESPNKRAAEERLEGVNIKQEVNDDDDDDLVIVKDEVIRTERRVPPLHGTSDDYDQSYDSSYGNMSGEPPTKHRRPMPRQMFHSGESSHSSDGFGQSDFSQLAAQVSQDTVEGMDDSGMWQPQPGPSGGGGPGGAGNMTLTCEWSNCGRTFTTRRGLDYHTQSKHTGQIQGVQCRYPDCGKYFQFKHNLYRHLRVNHNVNTKDNSMLNSYTGDIHTE